jgi:NADH-quinone oxidoreductase subunit N
MYFIPEVFIISSLAVLLPIGVIYAKVCVGGGKFFSEQFYSLFIILLFFIVYLYFNISDLTVVLFQGELLRDKLSFYFVFLVLFGLTSVSMLSMPYFARNFSYEFELYILLLIIFVGINIILFSNDFLNVYIGIEIQSLGLYILASYKQMSTYSVEAGVKYFILGAFASSLLLFGISLFYGLTGIFNFYNIFIFLSYDMYLNFEFFLFFFIALFFIFISLIFKVGGAPFHVWVPDVYEGVGTGITAFFSSVPKLGIFLFLMKIVFFMVYTGLVEFFYLFVYTGILSICVGSLGALYQTSIKRLLSYSAISHTGFILFGLSSWNTASIFSVILYLWVYVILIVSLFSILLLLQQQNSQHSIKLIGNLRYLYFENKGLCFSFIFALFSVAGVPPLGGFFAKYFIFFGTINAGYIFLSLFVILVSVFGFVYYLRLIRSTVSFIKEEKRLLFYSLDMNIVYYLVVYLVIINFLFCCGSSPFLYFFSILSVINLY